MSFIFKSIDEVGQELGARIRELRLNLNLTQEGLAHRAGISTGTIKRFEKTGQISLTSLLHISFALGSLENFDHLFTPKAAVPASIEDIINQPKKTKRGRLK